MVGRGSSRAGSLQIVWFEGSASTFQFIRATAKEKKQSQQHQQIARMSNNGGSTSDESLPRGLVPTRRRGWEGEALELERDDAPAGASTHAAVDLQQFRNTEVGKGYQAKHVVRQRTGLPSSRSEDVHDMTAAGGAKDKERSKRSSSKKSKKRKRRDSSPPLKDKDYDGRKRENSSFSSRGDSKSERLEKYLKCEGLKRFRKELESIVKES